MLLYDLECLRNGILVLVAAVITCAMYAYYVDSKRPDDDPKKKNYHPLAILLSPITLPLLIILSVFLYMLKVVTYFVFMVLFIIALIFIRKPFLLEWLKKNALFIGDKLMEANTFLIRIFLPPWAGSSGSA